MNPLRLPHPGDLAMMMVRRSFHSPPLLNPLVRPLHPRHPDSLPTFQLAPRFRANPLLPVLPCARPTQCRLPVFGRYLVKEVRIAARLGLLPLNPGQALSLLHRRCNELPKTLNHLY